MTSMVSGAGETKLSYENKPFQYVQATTNTATWNQPYSAAYYTIPPPVSSVGPIRLGCDPDTGRPSHGLSPNRRSNRNHRSRVVI
jgi:hypothetical protein